FDWTGRRGGSFHPRPADPGAKRDDAGGDRQGFGGDGLLGQVRHGPCGGGTEK
ncbi:unnamed protein product, partial [Durusdinium trenchii]